MSEVQKRVAENRLGKVTLIRIDLGTRAGLSAAALKTCFSALTRDTILDQTRLQIKKTPGAAIVIKTITGSRAE